MGVPKPARTLCVGALLLFAPKCVGCLLAYAGLGPALGAGALELCGVSADSGLAGWRWELAVVAGALTILVVQRFRRLRRSRGA